MLTRRSFLTKSSLTLAAAAYFPLWRELMAAPPVHTFKLKYAPNLGLLSNIEDPVDRLDEYAAFGFKAFEFNGLMSWEYSRAEKLKARMDKLGMEMGVFVANPGGWDKAGMVDPGQRPAFLAEVEKAVTYHKIMGNKWCTVITGPALEKPPRGLQRATLANTMATLQA